MYMLNYYEYCISKTTKYILFFISIFFLNKVPAYVGFILRYA